MIVLTTSWAPETALRNPGTKPHRPPATKPARAAAGIATTAGASASQTPTMTAPSAPTRNWPWAPMLNRPALNPNPTARPPNTSGVLLTSVETTASELPKAPSISAP